MLSATRLLNLIGTDHPVELFTVKKNYIYYDGKINSYIAAQMAGFIRDELLGRGRNFSFETVFSHESKLKIMQKTKALGYRIYFYYLATDDPAINIDRVNLRVAQKGHPVPIRKIIDRYYKSLDLMLPAVKSSTRAYLFDNSGRYYELVAQIDFGKQVEVLDLDKKPPNWFVEYFYKKTQI